MGSRVTPQNAGQATDVPDAITPVQESHHVDYNNWILTALLQIQKSLGELSGKSDSIDKRIDGLSSRVETISLDVKSCSKKVDRLNLLVAFIGGVFAVIGFIFALIPQDVRNGIFHAIYTLLTTQK